MSDAIKDSEGEWTVRRFGKVTATIEQAEGGVGFVISRKGSPLVRVKPSDWTVREARAHAALEAEMCQEGQYVKDLESLKRAHRRHEALDIRLKR